jgi:dGTPase
MSALKRTIGIENSYPFMNMEDISQVLIPKKDRRGGVYMTRQTHTFEVVAIAKLIATKIGFDNLDELTNVCLTHDLGHPPFGHKGAELLDEITQKYGVKEGFADNNATFDVISNNNIEMSNYELASLIKYPDRLYPRQSYLKDILAQEIEKESSVWGNKTRTVSCDIMDEADRIAYVTSDLVDSFSLGFTKLSLAPFLKKVKKDFPVYADILDVIIEGASNRDKRTVRKGFLDLKVMISEGFEWKNGKLTSVNAYRKFLNVLQKFTFEKYIWDSSVLAERDIALKALASCFEFTIENPKSMPSFYRKKYEEAECKISVVRDFISEMSDSSIMKLYKKIS